MRGLRLHRLQDNGGDVFGDDFNAFRVGVQSVGQVQRRVLRDALQEERIQRGVVFFRQVGKDGVEFVGEGFAGVERREHSGDDDARAGRFDFGEHRVQVVAGDGGGEVSEHVVGAEFHDDDVGLVGEHPVHAEESVGGGFAGDAVVDDGRRGAATGEGALKGGGEPVVGGQVVSGRQRVAEGGDDRRGGIVGGRGVGGGGEK